MAIRSKTPTIPRKRKPMAPRKTAPADGRASATQQVADAMRAEILGRASGDSYLGREDELVERYGVSKPTFRQAAKLLEHERILVIRRGPGGGFFAQPPTERMVAHMAAMVLSARRATLRQVAQVAAPLTVETIRMLAGNRDPQLRRRVAEYVQANAGFENLPDHRQRGRVIADFERLIADLAGNPALHLFVETIRTITRDPAYAGFQISKVQTAEVAACYRQLAQLIGEGEPEMATIVARRYVGMLVEWLPDVRAG